MIKKEDSAETFRGGQRRRSADSPSRPSQFNITVPTVELPKGGGAIRGIEEKFQVNAVSGTAAFNIPVPLSPSRHGFAPAVGLSYDSACGNGPFGMGWNVDIPLIKRKTERELPQYRDREESDTFILSGSEDLIPLLEESDDWKKKDILVEERGKEYTITRYVARIEGSFARIERWRANETDDVHWRVTSKDNIHAYYGLTTESRICDPNDGAKVFEWLLCRMHDDKGNIVLYRYKKEDFAGVSRLLNEKNRINNCTQIYIKNILYGNKSPYFLGDTEPLDDGFLFRVTFDYGEHDAAPLIPKDVDAEKSIWSCRKDPFSSCRSGFEIRTYRRCNRILVFHCFDESRLPHSPYLVKSLELFYNDEMELGGNGKTLDGLSYLVRARQNGHKWDDTAGRYLTKNLPDMDFTYQQHEWDTTIKEVTSEHTVHAPAGIDGRRYVWVDLLSEGISGILTEQANGWFYKSNLGNGDFSNGIPVATKPSFDGLSSGRLSIQELEANGIKSLVRLSGEPKGFFRLTHDEEWEPFRSFCSLPNIDVNASNSLFVDLNGDGIADLLTTEENVMRWYPAAGEKGFEVSRTVARQIDEEKGPAVVFSDQSQSIFLADMNGDGLTDLVRLRNGEICYWPNLGYGRFGAKVNMDNAPTFDHPDSFNPAYLRLADIDGSGTIDVIYLGKNDFRVWMNRSGNEWTTEPQTISPFPETCKPADIAVLDFLGSGTACIVYSSPLPENAGRPMKYVDLMGGKKPHVLIGYQNNCGREVSLEYKPSTHYYLEDKKEGRKWTTKLPFPVHCIAKVRVEDKVRETVFTNSYRYSHGYFDPHEREFRGFARVERLDTEDFSRFRFNAAKNVVEETLHQPPVRIVSWFHTGAYLGRDKILHQCKNEYFDNDQIPDYDLPEPYVGDDLSTEELREALRACKGLPLRSEVYAHDNLPQSRYPYSASQSTFEIRLMQPKKENKHASFLVVPSEAVSHGYERNPADPRVTHSLVLEADGRGNVTKSASVVYPRVRRPEAPDDVPDSVWQEQSRRHIAYEENLFTDDIMIDETYRLRVCYETKSYEVSGINIPEGSFVTKKDLFDQIRAAGEISFEEDFSASGQKRLSAHGRIYFLKDDVSGPLPLGKLSSLGIVHKRYRLAFTKKLVSKYYGEKVTNAMLESAKYTHSEGDGDWWAQSGTALYADDPKGNFYAPVGVCDVFGNKSFAEYDTYALLITSTTDAIGNKAVVVNDYRTLSPCMMTDPNLNRAAVETDELGMVVKAAVMGKEGAGEGDTLADPTVRMEYDVLNWQNSKKPNCAHTFAREQHGPANPRWQESYVYSDGGGNVIMHKVQAEPGRAKKWNSAAKEVEEVDTDPRWVGNGRTIVNNKGNPVKQYEPYFSTTYEYESEDELVETGVTPVLYYDPVGRNIRTEYPDGTFTKVEFDAWFSKSFDVNDTVKDSQWYTDRGRPDPSGLEPSDPERRAAWLAAKHHDTPATAHADSFSRTVYAVTDYGGGKTTSVRSESDLTGRYTKVFDQLGRCVSEGYTNLLGATIYGKSAEKGERWTLMDVMGRLVRIWDNDVREFRSTYDRLHRPVSTFVKEAAEETLFGHIVYGDMLADAAERNLKGRAYQLYDQAGVITLKSVDFKGNITEVERRLAKEYKKTINWKVLVDLALPDDINEKADPLLESELFSSSAVLDALNKPTLVTLPDKSVVKPEYNEANLLDSLRVKIRGEGDFVTFLEDQDYDAKGQRQFAEYGNGLITNYFYDPKTYRLVNLITKKEGMGDSQSHQHLKYTYDPVGNIVYLRDDAQQTYYFNNAVAKPECKFEYDAVYQLLKASGREHAGLGGTLQRDNNDLPFVGQLPHQNDFAAVRPYTELYEYDHCGNISSLKHVAAGANWVQNYHYEYGDDPSNNTNRLKSTSLPGDPDDGPYTAEYRYDVHGNMIKMPHLDELAWNFMDQLAMVNLGGGGVAFLVYALGGRRMRKIIERQGRKRIERIYLGAVEIYRQYQGDKKKLERSTLHVSDNTGRIAQIDTKLLDEDNADTANPINMKLIRYQYNNHLGSAVMETDEFGTVISYEEYHPYGTSAYRSSKSGVDLSLKRYRFSGKERDDETGLYYFGARYYAAWLARWTSSDPVGFVSGFNLYRYCSNNPIMLHDPNGLQERSHRYHTPAGQTREQARTYWENRIVTWEGRRVRVHVTSIDPGTNGAAWNIHTTLTPVDGGGNPAESGAGGPAAPSSAPPAAPQAAPGTGSSAPSSPTTHEPGGSSAPPLPPRPLIQPGPLPGPLPPSTPVPKVDLPQAPPGTNFAAAAQAGQAQARAANPNAYAIPGVQAHHALKWREGAATNLDPRITNDPRRIIPLQSWTRAVNDPDYPRQAPAGRSGGPYNTPHSYADRASYPYEEQIQEQRYSSIATERVIHARAGRASQREMTGSPGPRLPYIVGPTLTGLGGQFALAATRTFVPFVAEAEVAFSGASIYASAYYGHTVAGAAAGAAFETAAAYTPVVGGSLVAGAVAGNLAEDAVTSWTGDRDLGVAAGVVAAAGTGAAVGALIGSVVPIAGTAIGAGAGAIVGAIAGLAGYLITKLW